MNASPTTRFTRTRRILVVGFCLVTVLMTTQSAQADKWMFRRSYYSHEIPEELQDRFPRPVSRSAYRRPVMPYRHGFSIRGGFRYDRMFLRSGSSTDMTFYREDWFGIQP